MRVCKRDRSSENILTINKHILGADMHAPIRRPVVEPQEKNTEGNLSQNWLYMRTDHPRFLIDVKSCIGKFTENICSKFQDRLRGFTELGANINFPHYCGFSIMCTSLHVMSLRRRRFATAGWRISISRKYGKFYCIFYRINKTTLLLWQLGSFE